jgi:hypothetical protein
MTNLPPSESRFLENVGASTPHNPMGLHGLLQGYLCLYLFGSKHARLWGEFGPGQQAGVKILPSVVISLQINYYP